MIQIRAHATYLPPLPLLAIHYICIEARRAASEIPVVVVSGAAAVAAANANGEVCF